MKILVFAFEPRVCQAIAAGLTMPTVKKRLYSKKERIQQFIAAIDFSQYDYALGLGRYGRGAKELRIEATCSSRYGASKESATVEPIPYFLHEAPGIRLANGIGIGACNLVSYLILQKAPNMPYTFVHVPPKFDVQTAVDLLDAQLKQLA